MQYATIKSTGTNKETHPRMIQLSFDSHLPAPMEGCSPRPRGAKMRGGGLIYELKIVMSL